MPSVVELVLMSETMWKELGALLAAQRLDWIIIILDAKMKMNNKILLFILLNWFAMSQHFEQSSKVDDGMKTSAEQRHRSHNGVNDIACCSIVSGDESSDILNIRRVLFFFLLFFL